MMRIGQEEMWGCFVPTPTIPFSGLVEALSVFAYAGTLLLSHYQLAKDSSKAEEYEGAIPANTRRQAYFTLDPDQFNPVGLEKVIQVYPGTGKNGGIIKWIIPGTKIAIFEWDEDYRVGTHYHVMRVEDKNQHNGPHYWPGFPVPEPWNTLYFGG